MSQAGKTTLQLNQANNFFNANDYIVFIYGASTANTANSQAQTSIISVSNFASSLFPIFSPYQSVTANSTISNTQQSGTTFDNAGAAGEVDITLPPVVQGVKFTFLVKTVQTLKILAGGANTTIIIAGAMTLPNGNIEANILGASITLEGSGNNQWFAIATPDRSQWQLN